MSLLNHIYLFVVDKMTGLGLEGCQVPCPQGHKKEQQNKLNFDHRYRF